MQTHPHRPALLTDERGVAMIIALLSVMLLTALGLAVLMTTSTEATITSNYRDSGEALYAADAGVERVMQDLLTVPDWNRVLAGDVQSAFVDGLPGGTRTLPSGGLMDLSAATNLLNCAKVTACTAAEMDAATATRPYGPNNARWRLFAYAPMSQVIETGTVLSPMYVTVWIGDDPAEMDGNADEDTNGVLLMRAQAFGPAGATNIIEATLSRTNSTEFERGYTGQRGQDEQNRRARKAAVESPGKKLTVSSMSAATGGFSAQ